MPKHTRSQTSGLRAEAFVAKVVADAGFIWNPRQHDYGIDGAIELVDGNSEVTGASILAQVKGSDGGFVDEGCATFRFTCRKDHVDYWLRCGQPVVLICVDLLHQAAWWKRLDLWFADPLRRARGTVEFDRAADRFDRSAAAPLAAICTPVGQPLPRLAHGEELTSNLLRVKGFAPRINSASTPCRERGDAWERMKSNGSFEGGFHLYDGRIYSMARLDSGPLAVLCDGPTTAVATSDWSGAEDPDTSRSFVALLNYTLRAIHHRDLVWHPKKRVVYFQAPKDLSPKRIRGRSSRGRSVFRPYFGKDDTSRVRYCRHHAASLNFRRWSGEWFLEITPDYHFTVDGKRDSLFDAEYVKRIKQYERNGAVLGLVRAWAGFIRGERTLFGDRDNRVRFGELLTFRAEVGIDERAWIPPATILERVDAPQDQHMLKGLWDLSP